MNNQALNHLKFLMKQADCNEISLAEKSGVPQSTVNRILSGQTPEPRPSTLDKLASAFGFTWGELEAQARQQGGVSEPGSTYSNLRRKSGLFKLVPVLSIVRAGEFFESEIFDHAGEKLLPAPENAGPATVALVVEGDSMTSPYPNSRSYPEGVIIFVDPDRPAINGSRVVARKGSEYTFKSYIEDTGQRYLKPLNPQYPIIELNGEHEIVGVVIATYIPE